VTKNKLQVDKQLLDANFQLIISSLKLEGDRICGLVDGRNRDKYYMFKMLTLGEMEVTAYNYRRIKKMDRLTINSQQVSSYSVFSYQHDI
jgi:hypothetical protein